MAKKYTAKMDDAYDKKKGIKPGSKKDKALDKKLNRRLMGAAIMRRRARGG